MSRWRPFGEDSRPPIVEAPARAAVGAPFLIVPRGERRARNAPVLSPIRPPPLESAWDVVAAVGAAPRRSVPVRFTEYG